MSFRVQNLSSMRHNLSAVVHKMSFSASMMCRICLHLYTDCLLLCRNCLFWVVYHPLWRITVLRAHFFFLWRMTHHALAWVLPRAAASSLSALPSVEPHRTTRLPRNGLLPRKLILPTNLGLVRLGGWHSHPRRLNEGALTMKQPPPFAATVKPQATPHPTRHPGIKIRCAAIFLKPTQHSGDKKSNPAT